MFFKIAKVKADTRKLYLDREGVATIFEEIHSLFNIKVTSQGKKIAKMTEAQFENVWHVVDEDGSGGVSADELIRVFLAYDIWRY